MRSHSPWASSTRSPRERLRCGLAGWPLTRTRPRSQAWVACVRVLYMRATCSHLSRRTDMRASLAGQGAPQEGGPGERAAELGRAGGALEQDGVVAETLRPGEAGGRRHQAADGGEEEEPASEGRRHRRPGAEAPSPARGKPGGKAEGERRQGVDQEPLAVGARVRPLRPPAVGDGDGEEPGGGDRPRAHRAPRQLAAGEGGEPRRRTEERRREEEKAVHRREEDVPRRRRGDHPAAAVGGRQPAAEEGPPPEGERQGEEGGAGGG